MLQGRYGFDADNLWQMATGLGAGMSRRGYVCGAVTGAILALGMATAARRDSTREDIRGLREETYSKVQELTKHFEARLGSSECMALTGCDFRTDEGQRTFKEKGLMDTVCRPAVRLAVETVLDLEAWDPAS